MFSEIWLLLIDEIKQMREFVPYNSTLNQERLLTMMTFIQKNFHQKISLEEIAFQTGFSNSAYFSKIFKRTCHMTPVTYRKEFS